MKPQSRRLLRIAEEVLARKTTYEWWFLPNDFWEMFRGGNFGVAVEGSEHRVLALCWYIAVTESTKDWRR